MNYMCLMKVPAGYILSGVTELSIMTNKVKFYRSSRQMMCIINTALVHVDVHLKCNILQIIKRHK